MTFNPIQSIDKTLVAKRFAHARNTYGREARRRTKQYRQHTKLS